ncbi:hypothetical protein [Sporosarcina koreensis]|uniref:hypothetical protein n=1 Tax=Sporosarcina koreensis TaxID=334735 RepID=UPI000757696A|nr:hypothetical protein [Sporosarcina koreensis]
MARRPLKHFWSDGISDREFIMMVSVATFFAFAALGMGYAIIGGEVSATYLDILQMTVPPLMTIIASVFTIEGVEKIADHRKSKREDEVTTEETHSEGDDII